MPRKRDIRSNKFLILKCYKIFQSNKSMKCKKCGYSEPQMKKMFNSSLCKVCITFAPKNPVKFQDYISESIDWKILDTFRNTGEARGLKQKAGMSSKAFRGKLQSRPPMGYSVVEGGLVLNKEIIKVRRLFKTFLQENLSLNSLSKEFNISINGIKKILVNRTYLGEIKFDGKIYKGNHKEVINPEIFYAVQRKLKSRLNPRKK